MLVDANQPLTPVLPKIKPFLIFINSVSPENVAFNSHMVEKFLGSIFSPRYINFGIYAAH